MIYRHTRVDNDEVFYIGKAKSLKRAFAKNGRNIWWNRITQKYEYKVDIILDDLDFQQANMMEIFWIKIYGRKDKGLGTLVNMTDGGDGSLGNKGVKRTEKTKQNLKLSQPNRKKIIATKDSVSQIYESINELIKELFNLTKIDGKRYNSVRGTIQRVLRDKIKYKPNGKVQTYKKYKGYELKELEQKDA